MEPIKEFYLSRINDESGVSGTGIVARGVILPSGHCCLEWLTFTSSIAIYKSVQDLEAIHGHGGKTMLIFGTPEDKKSKKRKRKEDDDV
jgi:hypothetical protein